MYIWSRIFHFLGMASPRPNYTKRLFFAVVLWICVMIMFILHYDIQINTEEDAATLNRLKIVRLRQINNRQAQIQQAQGAAHEDQSVAVEQQVEEVQLHVTEQLKNLKGPGEMGMPLVMHKRKMSDEVAALYDKGWKDHAFNEYGSSLISLQRTLPDMRDKMCHANDFDENKLATTTVIVIFHNEAFSTLLRTVYSVINRSPARLLKEVILVDDNSTMPHLQSPLEEYIQKHFSEDKVRLLRTGKRQGLIRARIEGAQVARGEALVFLDSHCEVTKGWLEPMLQIILEKPKAAVVPIIEAISAETLEYRGSEVSLVQVGGFDWGLIFRWFNPEGDRLKRSNAVAPLPTPTMAGGLFAIGTKWFRDVGMYDPGMNVWGGENLELSFKVWMCGGEVLTSLCSHVGHIFRERSPYSWGAEKNVLARNLIRLAMVWLDDYKHYYLDRVSADLLTPEFYGDISERLLLREKLQCKNFSWYHHNVYPELFVPDESIAIGSIRNKRVSQCVDSQATKPNQKVIGYSCHGQMGNQLWYLSKNHEIRRDLYCIESKMDTTPVKTNAVKIARCTGSGKVPLKHIWEFNNGQLKNSQGMCLELALNNVDLMLNHCDLSNDGQIWIFHR